MPAPKQQRKPQSAGGAASAAAAPPKTNKASSASAPPAAAPAKKRRVLDDDDDGDLPSKKPKSSKNDGALQQPQFLGLGALVESNWHGKGEYFPGHVEAVHIGAGGVSYDIMYDDGFAEEAVPAYLVHEASDRSGDTTSVGSRRRWSTTDTQLLLRGVVKHGSDSNTSWTRIANDPEFCLGRHRTPAALALKFGTLNADKYVSPEPPRTGLSVEADFHGEGVWFRGEIGAYDAAKGLYYVVYDDGDEEQGVPGLRVNWYVLAQLRGTAPRATGVRHRTSTRPPGERSEEEADSLVTVTP